MKIKRIMRLGLNICLGWCFFSMTINAFANVGPVYYISSVNTSYNPSIPAFPAGYPYKAMSAYNQIYGVGDLDRPIGETGILTGALCGTFAHAYFEAKCVSLGFPDYEKYQVVIDKPSTTWRTAIDNLNKKMAVSGTIINHGGAEYYSSDLCAGFGMVSSGESIYIYTLPRWLPGTFCQISTPPTLTCASTISPGEIDFGTRNAQSIEALTKNVDLKTSCNGVASVSVVPMWGGESLAFTNDATGQPAGVSATVDIDGTLLKGRYTYSSRMGDLVKKVNFTLHQNGDFVPGPATAIAMFLLSYH